MNSREIEAAANAWLHRRDLGPWDAATQAAFERWLEESPRHRVAFLRLEHAWERAERLKALRPPDGALPAQGTWSDPARSTEVTAADLRADVARADAEESPAAIAANAGPQSGRRSRVIGWSAAAASVALGVAAATLWWNRPQATTYATTVGAVESVPIADGSTITLNTATQIRVALSKESRNIDLEQGEALFEVAKDPIRPFVVHASHKRVIAAGTKFSVRREGEDIRVVVTEGKVRIEADSDTPAAHAQLVAAGTVARAGDNDIVLTPVSLSRAEESLSWRRGILVFHDMTLSEAVAELNRYNAVQVAIEDPGAGRLPIAGEVRSTNVDAFVRMVEQGYHLRAERVQGRIVLRAIAP